MLAPAGKRRTTEVAGISKKSARRWAEKLYITGLYRNRDFIIAS